MCDIRVDTERLLLLPISYGCMRSLIDGTQTELEKQGFLICDDWISLEVLQYLDIIRALMSKDTAPDGFFTWAVIERDSRVIIGDVGFKGHPNELGVIDIGYGIAACARGKGYATEAVTALLAWAFSQPGARRVSAECLDDNSASIHILKKMGMKEIVRDGSTVFWEVKRDEFVNTSL
ncbi:MAG: GNAT family N-acetyltransferase [Acetanaerobacterium sp.]